MKNTALKVLLVMTIISSIFLCALLVILLKKGSGDGQTHSMLKEFQDQYDAHNTDTKTIAPKVYEDFSVTESLDELYDTQRHTEVYERIEALKREGTYTQDSPLVVYNPYGVNAHSVYVYFETTVPMKASYRVSVQENDIPTFAAECHAKDAYSTEHEYLLVGLTAAQNNRISLVLEDEEGNSGVRTFYVSAGSRFGVGNEKLDVAKGVSEAQPSDGMFVHFGNVTGGNEAIQVYDNDGVLRSEFPLLEGSAKRLVFYNDQLYYNISDTRFAAVDSFGRAHRIYTIDGYSIGEDYCLDENEKKLLVLASKHAKDGETVSVDDVLLAVDLISGEVKELVDMGTVLKEYKEICKKNEDGVLDWLGLNSVQMWDDTGVLLGAREASAAFKISDIYGIPMLEYIIGDELIFDGTGYENNLLIKTEEFEAFAGANTFTCVKEEWMPSGVYELYLYDNHIAGTDSRPEFDYSEMASDLGTSMKKGTTSYFCRYLVNETARTWELLETVPVDYSGYYGSAQVTEENHLITVTAGRFAYSEFDAERVLVRKYTAAGKERLGRVFKYDFSGLWFADDKRVAPVETEIEKE